MLMREHPYRGGDSTKLGEEKVRIGAQELQEGRTNERQETGMCYINIF